MVTVIKLLSGNLTASLTPLAAGGGGTALEALPLLDRHKKSCIRSLSYMTFAEQTEVRREREREREIYERGEREVYTVA